MGEGDSEAGVDLGTDLVRLGVADGVATITLDNPPLNALGHGLRAGLATAFRIASEDAQVRAIVLAAAGRSWPVGADIREFGKPPVPPTLPELCRQIAAATKPVIAALHGNALGGGLELALVAAIRVAAPGMSLGLPEVTLGILPGAGGTQRLPRLIGPAAALPMILTGQPVTAEVALASGLVDRVAADPLAEAQSLARAHAEGRLTLPLAARRRGRRGDVGEWLSVVAEARAVPRGPHQMAEARIIDCVEAALLLPPDRGLIFERSAFEDLVATPVARALRHAFFAERGASRSLPAEARKAAPLTRLAVIGTGPLGAGLAAQALRHGVEVTFTAKSAPALAEGLGRVGRLMDAMVARGEIDAGQRAADWARLNATVGGTPADGAEVIVDATRDEPLGLRRRLLSSLDSLLTGERAVLSLACSADPGELATATRAGHQATLWVTEPASRITLAELRADDAALPALKAAQALSERLGWRLLRTGTSAGGPGFVGRRLWTAYQDLADRCLSGGALPHEVDAAFRAWGMARGPFDRADVYGLDHRLYAPPERRAGTLADPVAEALRLELRAGKRTGRAAGRGYYRYDGARQLPDEAVTGELAGLRSRAALPRDALQARLVAGLANAGAWALAEGRAKAPVDVDLCAMAQGVPRWRGGLMQAADEMGPLLLRDLLRALAERGDGFWEPAPIWDELALKGGRFSDLNP